ncbi:hypothetical protein KUTeg_005097 [Tegillarca granosa]|uniref:Shieldin complex subunit 2 first OB fold domain-containing protein n=1 Tax=Tegillarca granosa TaxID=220873 RepID=A0ABQ9FIR4_TEGGR|nr:hypothetical protein KUTeg_005097 [Tegillarca granosa]
MQSATLEELCKERGQAPYNKKSLKVNVFCTDNIRSYKNDQGHEKKSLNVAIGDATMAMKCIIYDEVKFPKFKKGATLILKNIIKKTDAIVVTSALKAFTVPKVEIPEHIVNAGILIISPPPAEIKPLDDALRSPVKTRVSVMGQIIQEEATQEVKVHNDNVKVKTIYIKDNTISKCKVSLWRELCETDVRSGDHVSITNVVLNVFRGETSLSTTSLTKLQKCDAPEMKKTVTVIGCSVEDMEVSFLLCDESEITVPLDIVKTAFPTEGDLESCILGHCEAELDLQITSKGSEILKLSVV